MHCIHICLKWLQQNNCALKKKLSWDFVTGITHIEGKKLARTLGKGTVGRSGVCVSCVYVYEGERHISTLKCIQHAEWGNKDRVWKSGNGTLGLKERLLAIELRLEGKMHFREGFSLKNYVQKWSTIREHQTCSNQVCDSLSLLLNIWLRHFNFNFGCCGIPCSTQAFSRCRVVEDFLHLCLSEILAFNFLFL